MPPLLSISIIAFYLSILINLFFYFQIAKKDSRFKNLSSIGVLTAFTIGSFLLLNDFALKTIVSMLPLILYGFAIDFGKTEHGMLSEILSLLLSAVAIGLILHTTLKSPLFIFAIALILNRTPNTTKPLIFSYTLLFTLSALVCHRIECPNLINASAPLAVSTGSLIFINMKSERMKMGYSLKYSLNFFLSVLLIELLKKL